MLDIRHNLGLIISGIMHILILIIPVSFAVVQKFEEIELFVMTEDMPAPIKQIVQREKKIPEVKKETPQEQKPVEEPRQVEEKPLLQEEKVREPVSIQETKKDTTLPLVNANPPEPSVHQDVEFGTATGPKFLHKKLPVYPVHARRLGKEGKVVLRLTIDEQGNLMHVEVIEGAGYGFTEAA
ncbi:MAG: TonB family protein, partial [Candidatus Subteraquimicrobiales bacterium]|nr:TonB family protein [Candidatus Subteraquimicrobiales bacterium]